MKQSTARTILWIGAGYDVVLGLLIVLFHPFIYSYFNIIPANHPGYVELLALFVIVLGVMQGMAAKDPTSSRDLLTCALLMKLSYIGVVLSHRLVGSMPGLWVVFAWIDLAFAIFFATLLKVKQTTAAA